jgi:uncharacterized coiled-coil protein SlyX
MFNGDFDPYQKLEELYLRDITHEHNLDSVSDKLGEACELMEAMAAQIKHLTNAVIGLQAQNKILHQRVTRLEEVHG